MVDDTMIEHTLTNLMQQLLKVAEDGYVMAFLLPVRAGFILLPVGLGKPFKQGAPTSAAQLESVGQPPYPEIW